MAEFLTMQEAEDKFGKEFIQSQIKAKEEKVNTLLELMESDPEMKKRFEELMMNKTAK